MLKMSSRANSSALPEIMNGLFGHFRYLIWIIAIFLKEIFAGI